MGVMEVSNGSSATIVMTEGSSLYTFSKYCIKIIVDFRMFLVNKDFFVNNLTLSIKSFGKDIQVNSVY